MAGLAGLGFGGGPLQRGLWQMAQDRAPGRGFCALVALSVGVCCAGTPALTRYASARARCPPWRVHGVPTGALQAGQLTDCICLTVGCFTGALRPAGVTVRPPLLYRLVRRDTKYLWISRHRVELGVMDGTLSRHPSFALVTAPLPAPPGLRSGGDAERQFTKLAAGGGDVVSARVIESRPGRGLAPREIPAHFI